MIQYSDIFGLNWRNVEISCVLLALFRNNYHENGASNIKQVLKRCSDPHSLFADPDPAIQVIPDAGLAFQEKGH
jgi:hypothetical protein